MANIGTATVEQGDWLRDVADDREGCVTAVDGDDVTLAMNDGSERTRPVGELRFNSWDDKAQPDLDAAGTVYAANPGPTLNDQQPDDDPTGET